MTLPPIPDHLPAWQGPHLAWLASQGKPTRYAVPEGVEPCRADLREADLTGAILRWAVLTEADLREADLRKADLYCADLTGADLSEADLSEADLSGAELTGAKLIRAELRKADLRGAKLIRANLREANLRGADLYAARGIASIGPVGRHGRILYAVAHDDGPRVKAGCWWGSVDYTIARIEADYSDDPHARDRYIAAVRAVAAPVSL